MERTALRKCNEGRFVLFFVIFISPPDLSLFFDEIIYYIICCCSTEDLVWWCKYLNRYPSVDECMSSSSSKAIFLKDSYKTLVSIFEGMQVTK